jgi:biopolymer transport protein TolR
LASSIRLELPRAKGAQPGTPAHAVMLVVDTAGQAYLDDEPVGADALAQRLHQIAAEAPDTEVQLRADTAVPYGRVVEVMGALRCCSPVSRACVRVIPSGRICFALGFGQY